MENLINQLQSMEISDKIIIILLVIIVFGFVFFGLFKLVDWLFNAFKKWILFIMICILYKRYNFVPLKEGLKPLFFV